MPLFVGVDAVDEDIWHSLAPVSDGCVDPVDVVVCLPLAKLIFEVAVDAAIVEFVMIRTLWTRPYLKFGEKEGAKKCLISNHWTDRYSPTDPVK